MSERVRKIYEEVKAQNFHRKKLKKCYNNNASEKLSQIKGKSL